MTRATWMGLTVLYRTKCGRDCLVCEIRVGQVEMSHNSARTGGAVYGHQGVKVELTVLYVMGRTVLYVMGADCLACDRG